MPGRLLHCTGAKCELKIIVCAISIPQTEDGLCHRSILLLPPSPIPYIVLMCTRANDCPTRGPGDEAADISRKAICQYVSVAHTNSKSTSVRVTHVTRSLRGVPQPFPTTH